jgi:5-methylcytosine-specific restriction endonuclease McrA
MKNNLSKRVLVINKNYQAIRTTTVKRALKMLWNSTAVIVRPPSNENKNWEELTWEDWSKLKPNDSEELLQSSTKAFKIPEIIKLENYSKLPSQVVKLTRRAIYKRDELKCQYCGEKPKLDELSIDHLIPVSRSGKNTWENLVLACFRCNRRKANKLPEECGMKLIKKPTKPTFDILNGEKIRYDSWKNFVSDMYWNCDISDPDNII